MCEEEKEGGKTESGMYIVCYTPGYWVCVWEGCLGLKGMGKHGEKEFDTIDMDILVFLKFGGEVTGQWVGGRIS